MKRKVIKLLGLFLGAITLFGGGFYFGVFSAEYLYVGDITKELPLDMRENALDLNPWYENAVGCRLGSYSVYAPDDLNAEDILITGNNRVVLIDSMSVSVANERKGSGVLVSDSNSDGGLSYISYSTFNENGERDGEVSDWNRDGQPDFRFNTHGVIEFWVERQWYEAKTEDKKSGVLVDGKWKEVERSDGGGYRFKNSLGQ